MNYAEIARTGSSPKHAWNRRWPSQRKDIAFKAEKHRIHISLPNPRHILNKTPAVKWFRRLGKYLYDTIASVKNTAIALHSFLRRPPKLRMKTLHFHTRSKPLPVIQVFSLTTSFHWHTFSQLYRIEQFIAQLASENYYFLRSSPGMA